VYRSNIKCEVLALEILRFASGGARSECGRLQTALKRAVTARPWVGVGRLLGVIYAVGPKA